MEYSTHITLLARLSKGEDPYAWWEFQSRYLDLIRGFTRRYGLQAMDCDDVVQEVYLNLSRSLKSFDYDPDKGRFRAYLKTVVLHAIFRFLRQRESHRRLDESGHEQAASDDPGVEAMWEKEWRGYHIRHAMARLAHEFNENDRMAFTEYALMDRPAAETANKLGLSLDQVYQAKSRILKRLKELIAEQVDDEG